MWHCLRHPTFRHFSRTLTCDGHTHTQTETHSHGIYRAEHSSWVKTLCIWLLIKLPSIQMSSTQFKAFANIGLSISTTLLTPFPDDFDDFFTLCLYYLGISRTNAYTDQTYYIDVCNKTGNPAGRFFSLAFYIVYAVKCFQVID